jgi:phosphate transport system substrate-binding protein
MKRASIASRVLVLVSLAGILAWGCGRDGGPSASPGGARNAQTKAEEKGTIQIKGSDTLLQLSTEWAEVFMKAHPGIDVAVTGGGTGTGMAALLNGHADIANASREITKKETDQAKTAGKDIREIAIALDGITVIVHPSNPLGDISMTQLRRIYAGEVGNWKEVGGPDLEIIALSRENSSGTYAFFKEKVLENEEYTDRARFVTSNAAIVASVSEDRGAVGYVGLGYYEGAKDKVKGLPVKDANKEAVFPSVKSVKDKTYPLARTLYLYTCGEPRGAVKVYADFVLGPEGQDLVAKKGFVPVR